MAYDVYLELRLKPEVETVFLEAFLPEAADVVMTECCHLLTPSDVLLGCGLRSLSHYTADLEAI